MKKTSALVIKLGFPCIVFFSQAIGSTYELNGLTTSMLYQRYSEKPLPDELVVKYHAKVEEHARERSGMATNEASLKLYEDALVKYRGLVSRWSTIKRGNDKFRLEATIEVPKFSIETGTITGLGSGAKFKFPEVELVSGRFGGGESMHYEVEFVGDEINRIPVDELAFRQMAAKFSDKLRVIVVGDVVSGGTFQVTTEREMGINYKVWAARLHVRPTGIQIFADANTVLSYTTDLENTNATGDLSWIEELSRPIAKIGPSKKPSLIERKQLGEMLLDAAKAFDTDTMFQALDEGAMPNVQDQDGGGNVMVWAVRGMVDHKTPAAEQKSIIEKLAGYGCPASAETSVVRLMTMACELPGIDGFIALLRAGANPNPKAGITGISPLAEAASMGDMDKIRVLLAAKADTEFKSVIADGVFSNRRPDEVAIASNRLEAARLIRDFRQRGTQALAWDRVSATAFAPTKTNAKFSTLSEAESRPIFSGKAISTLDDLSAGIEGNHGEAVPQNTSTRGASGSAPSTTDALATPAFPSTNGAYALINGSWVLLPSNNGKPVVAPVAALGSLLGSIVKLPEKTTGATMAANLTFNGTEPIPSAPKSGVTLCFIGRIPELPAGAGDSPKAEVARTNSDKKGVRRAPMYNLGGGFMGFGRSRIDSVILDKGADVTVLMANADLEIGTYAVAFGAEVFEFTVQ